MNGRIALALCVSLLSFLLSSTAGYGQSPLPPSSEPGAIERQMRDMRPSMPKQTEDIVPPGLGSITAPAGAENLHFQLKSVQIQGSTVYSEQQLKPLYAPLLNTEISAAQLYDIASKITQQYMADGYYLSLAVVPPQHTKDGHVTLRVIEGSLADVEFEGRGAMGRSDLAKSWKARLTSEKPATNRTFEQVLLALNSLPGVKAAAYYEPLGKAFAPGQGRLRILIEQKPVEAGISVNNRGSRYVGSYLQNAFITTNNLLRMQEEITLQEGTSLPLDELRYGNISVAVPLNSHGTKLETEFSRSVSYPDFGSLKNLDVKSDVTRFKVGIEHPLWWNTFHRLMLNTSAELYNSSTDVLTSRPLIEDKLRTIRAGLDYTGQDEVLGLNSVTFDITQGLGILGASDENDPKLSRINGESNFTKANFDWYSERHITNRWSARLNATGQYAFDPLLSSEEFGVGGVRFGRAYDNSEITGDHGIAGSIELGYLQPIGMESLNAMEFYGFYDLGAAWQIENGEEDESASSAGLGIRTWLFDRIHMDLQAAKPLTRKTYHDNSPDKDWRFFFNMSVSY